MAEPWDADCQEIFREARRAAESLGHSWLGTEHVALGMLSRSDSLLRGKLRALGTEADALRQAIRQDLEGIESPGEGLPLTPRVKRMVERLASQEEIREIDLLTALLNAGPGSAVRALHRLQLTLQDVLDAMPAGPAMPTPLPLVAARPIQQNPVLVDFGVVRRPAPRPAVRLVGRERELEALLMALCRSDRVRPLLIGEPGVGKTALIQAAAARLARGDAPEMLRGLTLCEASELGTQTRTIYVIDELHRHDARALLTRPDVRWMATTTPSGAARLLADDAALQRRFHTLQLAPADAELTRRILDAVRREMEHRHHVQIEEDALDAAAAAHLPGRFHPDLALDLLDEACTWARKTGRVARTDVDEVVVARAGGV